MCGFTGSHHEVELHERNCAAFAATSRVKRLEVDVKLLKTEIKAISDAQKRSIMEADPFRALRCIHPCVPSWNAPLRLVFCLLAAFAFLFLPIWLATSFTKDLAALFGLLYYGSILSILSLVLVIGLMFYVFKLIQNLSDCRSTAYPSFMHVV